MPAGICAPNRFITITRSKAITQALTVFSAVQRAAGGGGAAAGMAGSAAAAAAAAASTAIGMARIRGLRLRAGARRIPASLENRVAVTGRRVDNAARRPGPGGHKTTLERP